MKTKKYMLTKKFLIQEYLAKEKSIRQVAKGIGCYHSLILYYLMKYNISRRSKSEANRGKKCSNYIDGRALKQYFCIDCRGEISYQTASQGKGRCWGCHCKRIKIPENNPNWQGGKTPLYNILHNIEEYKKWHTECLKRDLFKCQICGSKERLEVHHKKPFKLLLTEFLQEYNQFSPIEDKETLVRLAIKYKPFWDVNNGITYCGKHHRIIEMKNRIRNKEKVNV